MSESVPPAAAEVVEVGPPPPFDPELWAALEPVAQALGVVPSADLLPVMRARTGLPPLPTDDELSRDGAFTVEERRVPGPAGAPEVSLLLIRPTGVSGPTPALYYVHGGGMILGTNRMSIDGIIDLARPLGMAVVSVEYRLAPDTPHPGPVEDCYAGLSWVASHAAEVGIDPDRIVIGGTSAGGGLAAAVTLLARDRKGPALLGQLLMCPMLDDRNDTPSARQMVGRGVWDRAANEFGWQSLLGTERGGPDVSPYAAPARATDLSGLPPAYVDAGSSETFRDEDVAYAARIWQAGGTAELHIWPGGFHGFELFAPNARISQDARGARAMWLRRLLTDAVADSG